MASLSSPFFLVASSDPALLAVAQAVFGAGAAQVRVAMDAASAQAIMTGLQAPALAVVDERLPGMPPFMSIDRLLDQVRIESSGRSFPLVLLAREATPEWLDRLAAGIVDDLHPLDLDPGFLAARMDAVLRNHARSRELEMLRETASLSSQMDRLTGVYNRETILSMLFRETDRVQRMKSWLCLVLFDIDDFGHWNERLGEALCDDLLRRAVARAARLLRSYDILGRVGKDEFLVGLPGCSAANAVLFAERLRLEVFSRPFRTNGEAIRLSACFGVASSLGRSPVVVLHEAEQALATARSMGPESIHCAGDFPRPAPPPVAFLSASGDELLAW